MSNQSPGTMIRALRTERGMTQLDLARQMGVTDKAVSKWKNGRTYPDVQSLLLLSLAAMAWFTVQCTVWPTLLLALVLRRPRDNQRGRCGWHRHARDNSPA